MGLLMTALAIGGWMRELEPFVPPALLLLGALRVVVRIGIAVWSERQEFATIANRSRVAAQHPGQR